MHACMHVRAPCMQGCPTPHRRCMRASRMCMHRPSCMHADITAACMRCSSAIAPTAMRCQHTLPDARVGACMRSLLSHHHECAGASERPPRPLLCHGACCCRVATKLLSRYAATMACAAASVAAMHAQWPLRAVGDGQLSGRGGFRDPEKRGQGVHHGARCVGLDCLSHTSCVELVAARHQRGTSMPRARVPLLRKLQVARKSDGGDMFPPSLFLDTAAGDSSGLPPPCAKSS